MAEKNTLLIVDDYEFNRVMLSEMFPERKVIEAENGAKAIVEYEKHMDEICCVLTDIMMPGVDGFGLLEYFNEKRYIDNTPVFIISADGSNKTITRAFQLGVEDIITKPFNINFVKKHIESIIELYELRRVVSEMNGGDSDDEFV